RARRSTCAPGPRMATLSSRWETAGPGSPPARRIASSRSFIEARARRLAGRGWGSRSVAPSSKRTGAASGRSTGPKAARPSGSSCPSAVSPHPSAPPAPARQALSIFAAARSKEGELDGPWRPAVSLLPRFARAPSPSPAARRPAAAPAPPPHAIGEPNRLYLVGEKAFEDRLYPLSRRMLERFVEKFPSDPRVGDATLLLGRTRLAQGAADPALEAFKKVLSMTPVPGKPQEARFWEGEALYRLKRYTDARAAYARVIAAEPPSTLLPDALYGLGWTDLELKRRDAAVSDFRRLVKEFPEHSTTPAASIQLARALIDTKHPEEAVTLLEDFSKKYPDNRPAPEAAYYLARAKLAAGNTDEGLTQLRAFARTYPNHELASAARRAALEGQLKTGKKKDIADEYTALMEQKPATP